MTATTSPVHFQVQAVRCRHCKTEILVELPDGLQPGEQLEECERQSAELHHCDTRIIRVVSTGFAAPTRGRCIDSVAMQRGVRVDHCYVEASEQNPLRNVMTNQKSIIETLAPDDVVVLLDGDDWLAHARVLERVREMHDAGAWVTYGSFRYADGRPGFAAPYEPGENVRGVNWRATHLKTLRAGLFQRLRAEDFAWSEGAPVPWDMVVMFAAIEMAGWDRVTFCPEVLAVYSYATSHEWRTGNAGRIEEQRWESVVRALAPYSRIEVL